MIISSITTEKGTSFIIESNGGKWLADSPSKLLTILCNGNVLDVSEKQSLESPAMGCELEILNVKLEHAKTLVEIAKQKLDAITSKPSENKTFDQRLEEMTNMLEGMNAGEAERLILKLNTNHKRMFILSKSKNV